MSVFFLRTQPTGRTLLLLALLSVAYLALSYVLIGIKTEQVLLVVLFNGCFLLSDVSRRFILGFAIFAVFWIIYSYLKAFPNYAYGPVDVAGIYHREQRLFGTLHQGRLLTPNEFWLAHSNRFLDVLCGFFYLCWVPIPLAFAAYLFFKNRPLFFEFALTFLLANLIGFVIYYLHPAAPPWYVQQHGLAFRPLAMGSTAGLARFDQFFGAAIFQGIYAKNSNVFAAMPSLHSAYPLIVFYYALRNRTGWLTLFFFTVMVGIWFAAVYTSHHYVLDVLAGISVALSAIALIQLLLARSRWFNRFLSYYLRITAPA